MESISSNIFRWEDICENVTNYGKHATAEIETDSYIQTID